MKSLDLPDCEVCGNRRHVYTERGVERCECVIEYLRGKKLANFPRTEKIFRSRTLLENLDKDILLIANHSIYKPVIAGVVKYSPLDFSVRMVLAYDLMEAYLGEGGISEFTRTSLLVVLLAFSTLTNRAMGNVLEHVWIARETSGKSTWFVVPDESAPLEELYGEAFAGRVLQLPRINLNSAVKS